MTSVNVLCNVLKFASTFYDLGCLLRSHSISFSSILFSGHFFDMVTYSAFYKQPTVFGDFSIMYTNWFGLLCKQSAFPDCYRESFIADKLGHAFVSTLSDYLVCLYSSVSSIFMDVKSTDSVYASILHRVDCFDLLSIRRNDVINPYDYGSLLLYKHVNDEFLVVFLGLLFEMRSSMIKLEKTARCICSNFGCSLVLSKGVIGNSFNSYLGTVLLSALCINIHLTIPSSYYKCVVSKLNRFRRLEQKYLFMSFFNIVVVFSDLDNVRFIITKSSIGLNMFLGSVSDYGLKCVSIYRNWLH